MNKNKFTSEKSPLHIGRMQTLELLSFHYEDLKSTYSYKQYNECVKQEISKQNARKRFRSDRKQ